MLTLEIILALILGLVLGSFLNVCISRLPVHDSIVAPRSRCSRCETPLAAYDNIPLVSYALLRGRCRHCLERISWRYPFVEAAAAALTIACDLIFGHAFDGIAATTFCLLLLALAVCDAETLRLPDSLTLPLLAAGLLFRVNAGFRDAVQHGNPHPWHSAAALLLRGSIAAVAIALFLLILRWLYALLRRRQGMGLGDVKLAAGIAAWVGLRQTGVVLFLAVVVGALLSLLVVALRTNKSEDTRGAVAIPFGTFLCAAGIYCMFFGLATLNWYMRFFP